MGDLGSWVFFACNHLQRISAKTWWDFAKFLCSLSLKKKKKRVKYMIKSCHIEKSQKLLIVEFNNLLEMSK
jgi:hypothetical protein